MHFHEGNGLMNIADVSLTELRRFTIYKKGTGISKNYERNEGLSREFRVSLQYY